MPTHPNSWKPGDKIDSPIQQMQTFDFGAIPARDAYRLIISTIIPRPIALISTISPNGVTNLAPFSFYNGVSSNPPCLIVSIARRPSAKKKDTLRNIEETGQFVVNSSNEWLIEPLVHSAGEFPYETSELEVTGLTAVPSLKVKPPRVKESAVQMECEVHTLVPIGSADAGSATLVVGRILLMHVSQQALKDGRVQLSALKPVARLGGIAYSTVGDVFEIPIPAIGSKPGRSD